MTKQKTKKKGTVLLVIAIVLYALAIGSAVLGTINFMKGGFFGFPDYDLDAGEMIIEFEYDFDYSMSFITNSAVFFIWATVFLLIYIISNKRRMRENAENLEYNDDGKFIGTEKEEPKTRVYCAYCDSELDIDDKKCPYCGASKKIRKEDK